MPFAHNERISTCYDVEGQGPPLVLAHWSSDTSEVWRKLGYVDALKNDFSLILYDARGYGKSDQPHEPSEYESRLMVRDVVAVLDDLGIGKAHYFGYSMGARTGFRIATQCAERFVSFILGGCSPYTGKAESQFLDDVLEDFNMILADPEAAVRKREKTLGHSLTEEERKSFLSNDAKAIIASATGRFSWPALSDSELSSIPVPCLVYCGEADPAHRGAKESVNHIPQAKFVSVPGLDHTQAFVQKDEVLPAIKRFLADITRSSAAKTLDFVDRSPGTP